MRLTMDDCSSLPNASVGMTSVSCVAQCPIPILDHALKADGLTRGRVEQGLPLVCSDPLRTGDEVFAPRLWAIGAATGGHESLDERLLLVRGDRFHGQNSYDTALAGGGIVILL